MDRTKALNPMSEHDSFPDSLQLGLATLQREKAGALPPVESWNPAHCGDINIRIARDGRWFHDGRLIQRRELVRLFSTLLRKDANGFVLVTPVEKLRITVEDAPFQAVLLDVEGQGSMQKLVFTTNVGDVTVAGADNKLRVVTDPQSGAPSPYVHVRAGLEARLSRAVFYQLADIAVPGPQENMLGVWSGDQFFTLGPAR
jgi:hypothetical protein